MYLQTLIFQIIRLLLYHIYLTKTIHPLFAGRINQERKKTRAERNVHSLVRSQNGNVLQNKNEKNFNYAENEQEKKTGMVVVPERA